jgi:DNA-binding IclR family transcriptional regulator
MTISKTKRPRESTKTRRKQYTAPALEKGLDILELLSGEDLGLTISELAKKLGRSVGEVFRMMAVLEQRGYIQLRDDSDAYVLTLKMFELSHRFAPIARLSAASISVMKELANETGQSCHLVIHYEGRGHVVGQHDAPTDRIFSVRLGAEAPLLDTCSGHVLLAFADAQERRAMVGKIPAGQRKPRAEELEKLVRRVRKKGYERIKSAQVQGVKDIGYPIFDHAGGVVAALVVPYVAYLQESRSVPLDEVSGLTASAAQKISAVLGFIESGQ